MTAPLKLAAHLASRSAEPAIDGVWAVLQALDGQEAASALASTLAEVDRQAGALGLPPRRTQHLGRHHLMWRLPASAPAFATGHRQALLISAALEMERPHLVAATQEAGLAHGRAVARGGLMVGYGLAALAAVRELNAADVATGRDLVLSIEYRSRDAAPAGPPEVSLPELAHCAFALADCGGHTLHLDKGRIRPVAVAQKGAVWLRLVARGEAADPALPGGVSAAAQLSEALSRIERHDFALRPCAAARALLHGMAEVRGGLGPGLAARGLLGAATHAGVARRMPETERQLVHALLHDTVSVTRIRVGDRTDAISDRAEAVLDCRLIPGRSTADLIAELSAVVGNGLELTVLAERPGAEAPLHAPLLGMLCERLHAADPDARALPALQLGSCDAIAWRQGDIPCYGFTPLQLPPGIDFDAHWQHSGAALPAAAWSWGVEVFVHAVAQILVEG